MFNPTPAYRPFPLSSPFPTEYAVKVQDLSYAYGDHVALLNVSFSMARGELFGLLGPNGGGKTTLFRILSTLIRPQKGAAEILRFSTTSQPNEVRRHIGVVFQHIALDEDLTVHENLQFHAALYGLDDAALTARLRSLASDLGINGRMNDRIRTLSGGLKRRVDLVRGLLHSPSVLLLDEPTTGLDPVGRRAFWEALAQIRRKEGTTMLVATHLMEEADECDVVGIIDRGRLVALGSPESLKNDLSAETLWLETEDALMLSDLIQTRLGYQARIVGSAVQISHPEAHTLLSPLYEAFGDLIKSATLRKPTLEDVFMVHTGNRLGEYQPALSEVEAR